MMIGKKSINRIILKYFSTTIAFAILILILSLVVNKEKFDTEKFDTIRKHSIFMDDTNDELKVLVPQNNCN